MAKCNGVDATNLKLKRMETKKSDDDEDTDAAAVPVKDIVKDPKMRRHVAIAGLLW